MDIGLHKSILRHGAVAPGHHGYPRAAGLLTTIPPYPGRHFLEAVIKTKLANVLSNQDESDVAMSGSLVFVRRRS